MPEEPINPPPTSFVEWTDAQRNANLRETLETSPAPDELWVFGAGSLIWDPRFEPDETRAATEQAVTTTSTEGPGCRRTCTCRPVQRRAVRRE